MSIKEEKADKVKQEEALKLLKKNCEIYLDMNSKERSESIKIYYLLGLIKLSDNLKIDDESFITTLFDDLLFKDINILKNRNLFSNFISIFEKRKRSQELFQKKLFSLLKEFGNEYNLNSIYFHQYLIDISLYYIFTSSFVCEEKTKYIEMIIDNDIKPFETQLFKRIINKNEKLIDNNKNKLFMLKCLFNKFIDMNKYKSCLILFMKILENANGIYKNIPKEIIFELIEATNNKGFNHVIKKTKEINDFLIFNCLLLGNIDEKLFISEVELDLFDTYLVNLLNLLALKKDLNIDIFNKIFNCYTKNKYKNLNKCFFDVLYYLSTYSYSNTQQEFIFNCLNSSQSNLIYDKIIKNHLLSLNKRPLKLKESQINNHEKFIVENNIEKNDFDINNDSLYFLKNNTNNISFLNHLNLFNYIINSSFSIKKSTDNIINIHFYPKILNKILILLNNLSLENSNKKLFEEILMFLINLFSNLFNLYFSENDLIFNEDYLIDSFSKIIEKSSTDNKYLIIFPSFINIIKTNFYNMNNNISKNNKIYNFIFNYLITNFSCDDYSILNLQSILIYKSLIILFTDKKSSKQKKIFSLDKIIDLVIKSDNEKLTISFLKLCEELFKNNEEESINLSQYSLNKYSKFINENINESFIEFISEKFKELFMEKRPNNIEYDDNTYFIINSISNIYNNLCIKYKKISNDKLNSFIKLIEEFCGSNLINGICDNLFISIEKNESDMINIIKNENDIFVKYDKLSKALNNLDYYTYISDNYFNDNNDNNKISLCHYGIIKSFANLLSGYISNSIYILLNEEENKGENKNKQEKIIIDLLDYIKNKILLNETLKNTSYPVYFLNCLFSNKYIINYFIVHYSDYLVRNKIEKEGEQNSFVQEIYIKNNAFINYIRQNYFFILFMKDIINSYIEFDSLIIGNKNSIINNKKNSLKLYEKKNILNELKRSEEKSLSEYNENFKIMFNSFFTKLFLNEIFEKNNSMKSFQNKQIIFFFLLDSSFLDKYFNLFGHLINIDYTLIQIYSFIRTKTLSIETNEKIINFINKNFQLDNFGNLFIGIISNKKIFNSFYKYTNINRNYIYNLYNITKNIVNNLIMHMNEYKNINENLFVFLNNIFEHINNFYKINPNLSNLELYLLGKIINETISNLKKNIQNQIENNSLIESFYSQVVPKYMKSIFNIFQNIDNKNINFEYSLDNAFFSFLIATEIISDIIDNKKYYDILSSNLESNILNLFKEFHSYKNVIDLNYFSLFHEKYIEYRNDVHKKEFLEYLYLFSLLKGKQDEKNLKSIVVEFFGEYKDEQKKEDFKKLGYITCYFLSSIKKDSSISNKGKINMNINPGDFSIIRSIGERFKEVEKFLQKK